MCCNSTCGSLYAQFSWNKCCVPWFGWHAMHVCHLLSKAGFFCIWLLENVLFIGTPKKCRCFFYLLCVFPSFYFVCTIVHTHVPICCALGIYILLHRSAILLLLYCIDSFTTICGPSCCASCACSHVYSSCQRGHSASGCYLWHHRCLKLLWSYQYASILSFDDVCFAFVDS